MKTIEEAAKEYASNNTKSRLSNHITKTDFKAGAEFAQQWIPVSQKLPVNDDPVLIKDTTGLYEVGYYFKDEDLWTRPSLFLMSVSDITHWRPIKIE